MSETMTDLYDRKPPGPGHNQPEEEKNEVEMGTLDQEAHFRARALRHLFAPLQAVARPAARLFAKKLPWKGGPQQYGKQIINPHAAMVAQSIETHIEAYGPGAFGQKHGHMNSAVFYVLKGYGHDVHDGRHIPWKAGDVMIVENGCVHQHFNDDPENEAILLVMKAKPLFLFMHLLFQKIVSYPPNEPIKGHEDWQPPTDL